MPWSPMLPLRITASPGRAWLGRKPHALAHTPDSRGVDVDAVALSALHHLGVAGDDRSPRPGPRCRHGFHNAPQRRHGKALFQNEGRAQK